MHSKINGWLCCAGWQGPAGVRVRPTLVFSGLLRTTTLILGGLLSSTKAAADDAAD